MIQVGLHGVSDDGGRAEGETSAVLDDRDGQSRTTDAFRRLAAGAADDFNDLLTVIAGYSEVLLGREDLSADGRRSAEEIEQAGKRGLQQAELCGTESVLVVEAEPAVRTVVRSISCSTDIASWKPKTDS